MWVHRISLMRILMLFSHLRLHDRHGRRWVVRRERDRDSVQQATEADWLARARDLRCAEPPKPAAVARGSHSCRRVARRERQSVQ
jgi:hypothetical protein